MDFKFFPYYEYASKRVLELSTEIFGKESLPNIIALAIPAMLFFTWYEYKKLKKQSLYNQYDKKDFFSSLAIGTGNLIINAGVKFLMFSAVFFVYEISPLPKVPITWWSWIICLIFLDFCRYWAHRIAHERRFLWATHVTHHSSEKYTLSVSFRLSWTQQIKLIFFLPVVFFKFNPVQFFIIHQIEVLYQYWIHTELIRKLPRWVEYIFTTPSHHRVHHATNDNYIDKNYGSTFIIWDRMFGTFQPEEEQAVYGILKPVKTYNPVKLVFHVWQDIFNDIFRAKSVKQGVKAFFGRP